MGVNEVDFDASPLEGKIFIVTGTGKYFKNVEKDPESNLGIVRIGKGGKNVELLWGYKDGGRPTSEFPAHMMSHIARLSVDPENRVVMHSHPTNTLAMNYVHELDGKEVHAFPLGDVHRVHRRVPRRRGRPSLDALRHGRDRQGDRREDEELPPRRLAMHGIYGAGKTLDETFGLIETVEKAAQIYMLTAHLPRINTIKDEDMVKLVDLFGIDYRKDFLDL